MNMVIVCPFAVSGVNGVYDHSVILANELSKKGVKTNVEAVSGSTANFAVVLSNVLRANPDTVIVAYTPFLYGRWNSFPVKLMHHLRKRNIRTLTFIHEMFIPSYSSVKSLLVHKPYHYWLDRAVLRVSDLFAVTTRFRMEKLNEMGYGNCVMVPVFSNIPLSAEKLETVSLCNYIACTFGKMHEDFEIKTAIDGLRLAGLGELLHIGNGDKCMQNGVVHTGFVSGKEASSYLNSSRYFIVADRRGLSFRKGSAAAAFQHALPVIANRTAWTDPEFVDKENVMFFDGSAEGLASTLQILEKNEGLRKKIALGGKKLYDSLMSAEIAAETLLGFLGKK